MSQHSGMYNNTAWRKRRLRQLQAEPLCRMCRDMGRLTEATVADHIEPHHGDHVKFAGPLQSLCAACHSGAKQAYEATGKVRGCDVNGYPASGWLA
jgi:hypothetical protein